MATTETAKESAIARVLREIKTGDRLRLDEVGRQFIDPARPTGLAYTTIYAWATTGVRAASGRRVRLTAVKYGPVWVTSAAEVSRFLEARSEMPDVEVTAH
jgi:hypothetical protein